MNFKKNPDVQHTYIAKMNILPPDVFMIFHFFQMFKKYFQAEKQEQKLSRIRKPIYSSSEDDEDSDGMYNFNFNTINVFRS